MNRRRETICAKQFAVFTQAKYTVSFYCLLLDPHSESKNSNPSGACKFLDEISHNCLNDTLYRQPSSFVEIYLKLTNLNKQY